MSFYTFIKPGLFLIEAERAHAWAMGALRLLPRSVFVPPKKRSYTVMGMTFPHRVGLAAGLDKSGYYIDALAKLGFAFIEIGTITPKPQLGNPKPRLFRLPQAHALINRMGFNNSGIDVAVQNIQKSAYTGILGVNIGKGKETPLHRALEDYLYCLHRVFPYASYVTINISSPNTPDLRQLQKVEYFEHLVSSLRQEQLRLSDHYRRYVPLVLKISPDESNERLQSMAEVIKKNHIDGIIATNTTCERPSLKQMQYAEEIGGLSGKPLLTRSTQCLDLMKQIVGNEVTCIGVGGIDSKEAAIEKYAAGADLIQVYTGLIYQGPGLIAQLRTIDAT
ncbi:MAG TPA: quinone-dependent dihydroorotate dehydrogenase [Legionellaceae bacterium]|nr:quinone-dependent dihydroorotate dehydrogenase [Legionellaceae bacterium]